MCLCTLYASVRESQDACRVGWFYVLFGQMSRGSREPILNDGVRTLTESAVIDWLAVYRAAGALFEHTGGPAQPHAALTSEQHSDSYFNSRILLAPRWLRADLVRVLVSRLATDFDIESVDRVVGPAKGATKLAQALAKQIGSVRGRQCDWASPEPAILSGERRMVFTSKGWRVEAGERVLLCDDTVTTFGSVERTARSVVSCGGILLSPVLALLNRSGRAQVGAFSILALADLPKANVWYPEDCPLCEAGSHVIARPKDNWPLLVPPRAR